jgi:hypothetical protein
VNDELQLYPQKIKGGKANLSHLKEKQTKKPISELKKTQVQGVRFRIGT